MQGSKLGTLTVLHVLLRIAVPITQGHVPIDDRVLSDSWWVISISSFNKNKEIPWVLPSWLGLDKNICIHLTISSH